MLPILQAMSEISRFLKIVFFFVFGFAHGYFAFGIPLNDDPDSWGLETFLLIYRLAVVADFDLDEMEGLDPVGYLQDDGTYEFEPEPKLGLRQYYYCSRISLVAISFVVTVCLMNVFIAVLGSSYQRAYRYAWRNFMFARCETAVNYLAIKRGWDERPRCCRRRKVRASFSSLHIPVDKGFDENMVKHTEYIWYCCRRGVENSMTRIDRASEEMEEELTKQVDHLQSDIMQQIDS